VAIIPYLIQPWSFKLHVAEMIVMDYRNVARMPELQIYPPVWLRTTIRTLSWLFYAGYCFFLVLRFRLHYPGRNRVPFREALPVIRFMLYFLGIHFLMSIVFTAFYVLYLSDVYVERSDFMNQWLRLAFGTCALAIPIMMLFSPAVLYGIPKLVTSPPVDPVEESLPEVTRMEAGSGKDDLDPERSWETEEAGEDVSVRDRFEPLADRILPVMEEGKLYLDPDFSLDDLSQAMGVPKRHLYYCYNVILQTHFTRMRAECRVRHVKRMLQDGNNRHMTLDAIGLSSGFSSATAFRKAFREVTGMSPRDFQRRSDLSGS
jgi:AraC-like DNA-binding protein